MSNFLDPVKEDILQYLSLEPMTISELTDRMQRPYTTVQQAHKVLRDEGKIIPFDRKARNARWVVGNAPLGPTNTVPVIQLHGQRYKMTDFRGTKKLPEAATDATHDILKAWTVIATTADRLNGAIPDDVLIKRLNRQKINLNNARAIFESLAFFCSQMIDNPNFWNVAELDKYPLDKDWDEFQPYLKQMYDYYFKNEDD